ncbi:glycosyl hydrolase [Teratosphaeria nubilosa]|uniref:Vacuolar protein sorting/targeting protein 10 n=1 Tax=Teratosphaeria nubilosa TaxID=161662 RepID=A0A6G1KT72_9PEZI|nr:glycosyl hydrolase [Teratosphaeria nubilosa]
MARDIGTSSTGRWAAVVVVVVAFLFSNIVSAAKSAPGLEETAFDANIGALTYFDDSNVILLVAGATTYRSEDAGVKWSPVTGPEEGDTFIVMKHSHNNDVAVLLGNRREHWITKDQGKTWTKFEIDEAPSMSRVAVAFHGTDPDRMLFHAADCIFTLCEDTVYYTLDGFKTKKKLRDDAVSCLWAKSNDRFTTGSEDLDKNQILCIVRGSMSPFSADYRLKVSDDFFAHESEPSLHSDGRPVTGLVNVAAVKSYIVAAAKSEMTTELAMYVTDDSLTWHRAEFGEHKLEEDAYTLLESTNYSMQVDVLTTKPTSPMGVLLTSNSNGTFFTKNVEHTNRNIHGYVDFEKIQNIQGIVLVNTVKNWEEVEKSYMAKKEVVTQISFDDGRTWQSLKADGKDLHLHSVTDQSNFGRIFSSPAPGIVMGIGNTGKQLGRYEDGDTYVSDDAGLTWTKALDGPHLYEFGDQGALLVAIEEKDDADKIKWSLNHGKDWKEAELKDLGAQAESVEPIGLTTTPDSTSLRFLLVAKSGKGSDSNHIVYSLGFEGLHEDKCKKGDFEDWYARVDDKGEPTCIMGHTQKFRRRKANKECFVDDEFNDPLPQAEDCKCTADDYECDYENNFVWDGERKKCVSSGPLKAPAGACDDPSATYMGSSGYQKIPGNTCVDRGGEKLDKPVERKCSEAGKAPPSGKIATEITTFKDANNFVEYYYLEAPSLNREEGKDPDETIVMRTDEHKAYITRDHGKTWAKVDTGGEDAVAIYPHQYNNDAVYLITPTKTVFYTHNRGGTFHSFEAPEEPNHSDPTHAAVQILQFHPDPRKKEWLIWTGIRSDQFIAHVSQKGGDDWETLLRSVRKCQFVYREDRNNSTDLVLCEQREDEDPTAPIQLVSSVDFFRNKNELKRDVINFATMAEYIVVAAKDDEKQSLVASTSIDGQVFADAHFPPNLNVEHQQAYTVLDSNTHAIFLHVTVNNVADAEYGSIVKSNSNGTNYVLSANEVNRNGPGYVDFEKMQSLEGVSVINRVANAEEVQGGASKKIKTYMTHNDGADWALIARPKDPTGPDAEPYACSGSGEKCTLHLHGYTERNDPRHTYSSPSATGLMFGTGNVGEFLSSKKEADTFMSTDGGVTWKFVAKGNYMWEFGDQGSILCIVKEDEATSEVLYSLDEGDTWTKHTFSDKVMTVDDITTVPSDTSRNFMLWGKIGGDLVSVNLDFSGLEERAKACKLDDKNPDSPDSDYYLWSPKHPESKDDCLFGHVAQYHRKKVGAKCYNGRELDHLHNIARNCTCSRKDFECDYNYERLSDSSCRLIDGLAKPDPQAVCFNEPFPVEYYDITGYRRIPLTTCQGGQELDLTSRVQPCPGKEPEFEKKHGISGLGLFFAIVIPVAAAAGAGYWVWQNWDGKFGRIQLGGESYGGTGHGAFDRDAPWIKYPVVAVSGLVAVLGALPMVASSLWRTVSTALGWSSRGGGGGGDGAYSRPFTSRSSFARGRGDYAIVDPDEGELLGDESDEDV